MEFAEELKRAHVACGLLESLGYDEDEILEVLADVDDTWTGLGIALANAVKEKYVRIRHQAGFADAASRERAYDSLTKVGVAPDDALVIAGLPKRERIPTMAMALQPDPVYSPGYDTAIAAEYHRLFPQGDGVWDAAYVMGVARGREEARNAAE